MVAVFALSLLSILRERANFERDLEEQANLLLGTTSLTIRDQLYRIELDELLAVAHVVGENPKVTMFVVYDAQGKVLVDSRQASAGFSQSIDPLGQTLVTLNPKTVYTNWQTDQLVAGRPVTLGNQVIGAVATGLSTEPLDRKISQITYQGILLGLITLAIGGALTFLLARQITNPLIELANLSTYMAGGNLSIRATLRSKDEIGRLGEAFNLMAVGLQEREWLRDMFGRFVSQEVAEAIRTGQVKLEGENRVVSVLFCDIRDFTDFSERHTPQEVVTMLNEYLPVVVQAAQKYGGMVNKFGGDSSLIIYGAPYDIEDSAYQAVLTGLEIRTGLENLNKRLEKFGEKPIRVGVGINTGMALAGAVGPSERQEYTVIGKTVNLAARIDALNKQYPEYDILISGWTYEALGIHRDEFEMFSLGAVEIRGKREPVDIWAVQGKQ